MSEAYRRLREGLPAPSDGAVFAHADAKRAQAWVATLPRANPLASRQQLANALDGLAARALDGTQRLGVLEALRPPVLEVITALDRGLVDSALPLPPAKAQSMRDVQDLHMALAHGYRRAAAELCAPAGSVPMLRGAAALQTLQRAAFHYAQALALDWRFYREPAAGAWLGLHRVQRFAASLKIDDKRMDEATVAAGGPKPGKFGLRGLYLQTLLVAVANPYAYSQAEQTLLWTLCGEFAGGVMLLRGAEAKRHPDAIAVPDDGDRGPGGRSDENVLRLQVDVMIATVLGALQSAPPDEVQIVATSGARLQVGTELLRRLARAFEQASARRHARLAGGHALQTVIGMSGLHQLLAGQDFESFVARATRAAEDGGHELLVARGSDRAGWAHAGADGARAMPLVANVLDQSLGGYRLSWDNGSALRARVGELIGLCLPDPDAPADEPASWMVGILCWLRFESEGRVNAGVQLLSRTATAIAICAMDTPHRAIHIRLIDAVCAVPADDARHPAAIHDTAFCDSALDGTLAADASAGHPSADHDDTRNRQLQPRAGDAFLGDMVRADVDRAGVLQDGMLQDGMLQDGMLQADVLQADVFQADAFLADARANLPGRSVEVLRVPADTGLIDEDPLPVRAFDALDVVVSTGEYEVLRPHAAAAVTAEAVA